MPILGFGIFRSIKQQQQFYDSYTLTIAEDQITREQYNTPTITLPVSDITCIARNRNESFIIKGSSALNVISVYKHIAEYDVLETQVNEINPVIIQAT